MNLAFGILFLWLGAACIWLAARGTDAATPWGAYRAVLDGISKGVEA